MAQKGQIVEIPANSPLYKEFPPRFTSRKQELLFRSRVPHYTLFDGFLVGEHQGLSGFQLGQRKGINVGGKNAPLFVIGFDITENRLFVGEGEAHPGLFTRTFAFHAAQFKWYRDIPFQAQHADHGLSVEIQTSFNSKIIPAKLFLFEDQIFIDFDRKVCRKLQNQFFGIYRNQILLADLI
ncbi:tRNA methyl transferase PRC-barrel domain-containing protein [Kaistella palustris]|uniref:tRNA methyl transferase PRC-barrel domain-containing protein n=1 Tax=Kaistella palustris TaxID=493376 RepID=UPI0004011039|nr:tRNA methyl transferase PRC-barrel domain-containing protein [Kaistella palustris]